MNVIQERNNKMAATFTFDSAEEDWDLNTLHVLNSQLEAYLKMVCSLCSWIILFPCY